MIGYRPFLGRVRIIGQGTVWTQASLNAVALQIHGMITALPDGPDKDGFFKRLILCESLIATANTPYLLSNAQLCLAALQSDVSSASSGTSTSSGSSGGIPTWVYVLGVVGLGVGAYLVIENNS